MICYFFGRGFNDLYYCRAFAACKKGESGSKNFEENPDSLLDTNAAVMLV